MNCVISDWPSLTAVFTKTEPCGKIAVHGILVSFATVSRAVKRLNWTRKKKTDAERASKMKLTALPGENKPRHWMHVNSCSLMNAARTLPYDYPAGRLWVVYPLRLPT
jgi:arginine repressor